MARKYVPIFFDWTETTIDLSQEQKGNLIDAIVDYASEQRSLEEIVASMKGVEERVAFRFLKGQVDRNDEISAARSKAGSNKSNQNTTNCIKDEQTPTKQTKENKIVEEKTGKRFVPPTVEEVTAYCKERNNGIDPQYFVDYQIARNWVLSNGKKMVDWKATIRTWENNDFRKNGGSKKVTAQKYGQRDYSEEQDDAMKRMIELGVG